MKDDLQAKLEEILKRLDAQAKNIIDLKVYERLAGKVILNNTQAGELLGVCPRQMYNLRAKHGLDYYLVRNRPAHTWQHIYDYVKKLGEQ